MLFNSNRAIPVHAKMKSKNQTKIHYENVLLSLEDVGLNGELSIPEGANSIVMFVDGSGAKSSVDRDRYLAKAFNRNGLATLLFDLKTEEEVVETETDDLSPYIEFLARRVADATWWLKENPDTASIKLGYFGTAMSAAAALVVAASIPRHVHAIVCYSSRPDLAGGSLAKVEAPTLLMVAADNDYLLEINRDAASLLNCEYHIEVVSARLDEEDEDEDKVALDKAAEQACKWFGWHLDKA